MLLKNVKGLLKYNHGNVVAVSNILLSSSVRNIEKRPYGNLVAYKHCIGSRPLQYTTLGQVLEKSANLWPDRAAVISRHENRIITYSELVEEADKLAAALLKLGMLPGDRFGIWSFNCIEWIVAGMAAARSGMISVAINPLYNGRELEFCLKKVGVKVLLAHEIVRNHDYYKILTEIIPELPSYEPGELNNSKFNDLKNIILITNKNDIPGVMTYKKLLDTVSRYDGDAVSRNINQINPESGCNIQFTSGTTGSPKAPLLSHHNIVNNGYFIGLRNELDVGHKIICVQVPLFHVYGLVITIAAAIHHGATMVLPSEKYSVTANIEALLAEKCDIIHGTPTMYIDLVNEVRARGVVGVSAEMALTGGSPVTPQLVQDMNKILNVKTVKSLFGMTEGTASSFQSVPGEDADRPLHYVGLLQDHHEAKIVDENDNIVPFGTPGELLTRGYANMIGYWGDETKTKETITVNGWLRSGDQMVLHENGYGQIVGRLKDLIIRGGENIAPKEIEDIVSSHPDVVECQVFGVHDDRLGEEVCATVRMKHGADFDDIILQKYCTEHLAKFKVPKMFKQVEQFPKTASGKVQKFKLRKMVESGEL